MDYVKTRWAKTLGLTFLMTLSLMALLVSGALASEQAWLVEGKDITSNQTVEMSTHAEGGFKIEKETNLEILCTTVEAENLVLITGTTESKGKIKLKSCKTWQNGKDISANCKPVEPITLGVKGLLILHGEPKPKVYILYEAEIAGASLGIIKYKETCALPESNSLKGSLMMECLKPSNLEAVDCRQEEVGHLLKPNESLFPEDQLLYGTKVVKFTFWSWLIRLVTGKGWSGTK